MIIGFYDLETTGINDPAERIIEAALVRCDDKGNRLDEKVWRIDPLVNIKPSAQKVHGISADQVKGQPTFDLVAPEIAEMIDECDMIVAHNGDDFDFDFTVREMKRVMCPFTLPRTFDTMKQARWATWNGKLPSLQELARCMDVDYDPDQAHAALYDVNIMARCFFEGVRIGAFSI